MDQINELEETFIEEYSAAKLLIQNKMTKSATILLSKSLFALADYIIFKKYKKLPKNHSERFRILELKEPKFYIELDKMWSKYTDSYSKPTTKESTIQFLNIITKLINENETISQKIKNTIKK
ncbi:hypothetical protein HN415_07395 [Candidatus Woesearchaeota archaeon]|jgi:hypothetical protein|nr:hypothetical protein [Candidatus Woesearchaeota archaeon]